MILSQLICAQGSATIPGSAPLDRDQGLPKNRGIDPEYGRRMAVLPKVFGLSDAEFAASLGIGRDRWWTYKAGKSRPRQDAMEALYHRYGITADYVWLGLIDGIRRNDVRNKIARALADEPV